MINLKKIKVLFQGDSITDAGRSYENEHNLGEGYPKYAALELIKRHPEIDFDFINLGINGNKTDDLLARLDRDFIDKAPDAVSILIGVNDCWHFAGDGNFRDVSVFVNNYGKILTALREKTSAKIMLIEPFLLPVDDKAFWRCKVDEEIVATRALAKRFGCVLCPMDGLLAGEYCNRDIFEFSADGVHPLPFMAEIMGKFYADYFEKLAL